MLLLPWLGGKSHPDPQWTLYEGPRYIHQSCRQRGFPVTSKHLLNLFCVSSCEPSRMPLKKGGDNTWPNKCVCFNETWCLLDVFQGWLRYKSWQSFSVAGVGAKPHKLFIFFCVLCVYYCGNWWSSFVFRGNTCRVSSIQLATSINCVQP